MKMTFIQSSECSPKLSEDDSVMLLEVDRKSPQRQDHYLWRELLIWYPFYMQKLTKKEKYTPYEEISS